MAKQLINLTKRTAQVTNLNTQPEKHGDHLDKRVDLNLSVLLEHGELDMIVRTRWEDAEKVLFDDKGEPQFTDIDKFKVGIQAEGTIELAFVNGDEAYKFEAGVLKSVTIEPLIGRKATMTCQVRIDPEAHLDELYDMRIAQRCQFSFLGHGGVDPAGNNQTPLV